jgi:hypothetical protein
MQKMRMCPFSIMGSLLPMEFLKHSKYLGEFHLHCAGTWTDSIDLLLCWGYPWSTTV